MCKSNPLFILQNNYWHDDDLNTDKQDELFMTFGTPYSIGNVERYAYAAFKTMTNCVGVVKENGSMLTLSPNYNHSIICPWIKTNYSLEKGTIIIIFDKPLHAVYSGVIEWYERL